MKRCVALLLLLLAGCVKENHDPEPPAPKKEDAPQLFVIEDSRTKDKYLLALKKDGSHKIVQSHYARGGTPVNDYYSGTWKFDGQGKLHLQGKSYDGQSRPVMLRGEHRSYEYVFPGLPKKGEKLKEELKERLLLTN